jgi:hypothetical protein
MFRFCRVCFGLGWLELGEERLPCACGAASRRIVYGEYAEAAKPVWQVRRTWDLQQAAKI